MIITLGGRPRFRGTADVAEVASVPLLAVFLFLLPLGLPRPRFAGRLSAVSVVPGGIKRCRSQGDVNREGASHRIDVRDILARVEKKLTAFVLGFWLRLRLVQFINGLLSLACLILLVLRRCRHHERLEGREIRVGCNWIEEEREIEVGKKVDRL